MNKFIPPESWSDDAIAAYGKAQERITELEAKLADADTSNNALAECVHMLTVERDQLRDALDDISNLVYRADSDHILLDRALNIADEALKQ